MIKRSEKEVVEFCNGLWPDKDIEIEWKYDQLSVSRMYDAPDLTLSHLMALAKFFNTMNVGKFDDISEPGCETCDYRSAYGFRLSVEDGPKPPE